ncbi:hypothetical protein ABZ468_16695 [Streptomyces sp. NPDC005708]|uniref:hypothetical protein n=1 Tax=Streptomyces sp. NPDC005708 TaxID=3154564 RepID=UPI0033F9DD6B
MLPDGAPAELIEVAGALEDAGPPAESVVLGLVDSDVVGVGVCGGVEVGGCDEGGVVTGVDGFDVGDLVGDFDGDFRSPGPNRSAFPSRCCPTVRLPS